MEKQDKLREAGSQRTDELLKKINIDALISNPEKTLNEFCKTLIMKNSDLYKQAKKNGAELAT